MLHATGRHAKIALVRNVTREDSHGSPTEAAAPSMKFVGAAILYRLQEPQPLTKRVVNVQKENSSPQKTRNLAKIYHHASQEGICALRELARLIMSVSLVPRADLVGPTKKLAQSGP